MRLEKNQSGALLIVMMDIAESHEASFASWLEQEHLPERLACPGFLSARRFAAIEGSPKWMNMYELSGPEALESQEYRSLPKTPGTLEMLKNRNPDTYRRGLYRELPGPSW
jgi:hypothetical protein